jgi:hypothetical protein
MTPCDGTSTSEKWCCGTANTSCCATNPIAIPAKFGFDPTTDLRAAASNAVSSVQSSREASTLISSFSNLHSATGTAQASRPNSSSSLSGGAIAGIVIGSIIGVAIVFFAGVLVARRKLRSRYNAPPMQATGPTYYNEQKIPQSYTAEAMDSQIAEAPATSVRGHERRSKIQEMP